MQIFFFVNIILFGLSTVVSAASIQWGDWYDNPNLNPSSEGAFSVAAVGNGAFIAAGNTISATGISQSMVRGYGSAPTPRTRFLVFPSMFIGSSASHITASTSGVVIVGGEAYLANWQRYVFIQSLDPNTGAPLWTFPHFPLGRGLQNQYLVKLIADSNDNFYALMRAQDSTGSADAYVVKFTPAGQILWTYRYRGAVPGYYNPNDNPKNILLTSSGTVLVMGHSLPAGSSAGAFRFGRPWAIALNANPATSLGEMLGEFGLSITDGYATHVKELASGDYIFTGSFLNALSLDVDIWTRRMRPDFTLNWHTDYDAAAYSDETPADLLISPTTGDPLILTSSTGQTTSVLMLIGFSQATGTLNVQNPFYMPDTNSVMDPVQMTLMPNNSILIGANYYLKNYTTNLVDESRWAFIKCNLVGNIHPGYPLIIANPNGITESHLLAQFAIDSTGVLAAGQSANQDVDFTAYFINP